MGSFANALFEALVSAGVSPDRARSVVDLFDRSVDERYGLHAQVLATKRDLAELETRLVREIAEARVEIAESRVEIAGFRAEIEGFRVEIAGAKVEMVKWMLAALTAQTMVLLAAIRLL